MHLKFPRLNKRRAAIAAALILALVYIVQLVLPSDYFLPRTYIGSQSVSLQQRQEVEGILKKRSSVIEIKYGNKKDTIPANEIGITTDVDKTLDQIPILSFADRIVPFKLLYLSVRTKTVKPVFTTDTSKINAYVAKASQKMSKLPVDATASFKEGKLVLTDDESGIIFEQAKITQALAKSNPLSGAPVVVASTRVPAKTQLKELEPLKELLKTKTTTPIKITFGTTAKTISPEEYAKWFKVVHNTSEDVWSLGFDDAALDAKITEWAKEYNIAPGYTQVSYLDDVEISRNTGRAGRALDAPAIKQQFGQWLDAPSEAPVQLATSVLAPQIIATRTYSYSSAQLQARLNNWINSRSGNYQVAIRELGGRGREASHNVAQQTVMASTYKTFLAFVAYRQAENGALNLSEQLHDGKNIEQCIEVMIVRSDNDCAVKLGRYIGWAKVDAIIAAAGFEGTILNNYDSNGNLRGDKLVNARQQANFLAQLSNGSLINGPHSNSLLGYMKRQTYRDGIPAGSRGAAVADKVGFLDNYIHDVGIVYGPKSTYALVIMSEGSNWSDIRNLAEAVYEFMSQ